MDYLHMSLCTADSASLPDGWSRCVQFSFRVVNQIKDEYNLTKVTQLQFNKLQRDQGFVKFIPHGVLFDPSRGYLLNDTLVVEVEVLCNVDEKDTAEHLWERLKKDREVKEHKNKETTVANLYAFIKVVRDEDLAKQIGKDIYFDLVDHDKVGIFYVQRQKSFNDLKEEVAVAFGIPAQFQRFWLWEKRQNHTCRPSRPLTNIEEAGPVGKFRDVDYDDMVELELFLEVECGLLYDPEKEELCYVGRLFVNCTGKPSEILTSLNNLAGFDPDEEIELYEEIKFEPNVMCEPVYQKLTFQESELENGDIICHQKASAIDIVKHILYPDVPSYLEYVHNTLVPLFPSNTESKDEESFEEQNENIMAKETNVDKNTEAKQLKVNIDRSC
ncbi:ubiquitin carboxyl-terminal hydrolase [Medicago truncatula]|uniref:Ubiquitin carboxyl-terminal hydrolase n=1 Tax=Medicago truncatula TaxID=3880 RepID=G7KD65_MEDTR|nr:ubiquitin carboxyl-terminal hydrolase [Medicago truncatula]